MSDRDPGSAGVPPAQNLMSDHAPIVEAEAWRLADGELRPAQAHLVVEEPLEIFVDGAPYATLMRTPGDDRALAAGFCLAEGLVDGLQDIGAIAVCEQTWRDALAPQAGETPAAPDVNRVFVTRAGGRGAEGPPSRAPRLAIASSCGLCGREMIEDMLRHPPPITRQARLPAARLLEIGRKMQDSQRYFRLTGATHAAALFNAEVDLLAFGEDIGRHNALDKAIGRLLIEDRLQQACLAALSGRCSFEMVQKAARAGIPVVAGVSAPTHLAVQLAQRVGLTLVGFLRERSFTIYTGRERLVEARA